MAGSDPIVAGTRFVLKHQFSGFPKNEDFDFVEDPMPPLKDGQILMDALFMSVDPYMRPYVSRLTTPFTMIGMGVYKIRESRDTEYPQGGTVVANIGWVKTGNYISIFKFVPSFVTYSVLPIKRGGCYIQGGKFFHSLHETLQSGWKIVQK